MLIHCPKCGFEQPKDTYCAKCGVDMISYEAPEPSIQERTLKSSAFYSFLFLVLAIGSTYYFTSKYKNFDRKIEEYNISKLNELISQDPSPESSKFREKSEPEPEQVDDDLQLATIEAKQEAEPDKVDWSTSNIVIRIIELPVNFLEGINGKAEVRQQANDYRLFRLTSSSKLDLPSLDLFPPQNLAINSPDKIYQYAETGSAQDHNFELSVKWQEDGTRIKAEIVVSFLLPDSKQLRETAFSYSDSIGPEQALILQGLLPQEPISDWKSEANGPLSIYQSPSFTRGDTDFFLFISIQKP